MAKLGYTWFTKDWRSNMNVSQLSLQEKGFYRELIDECFLQSSNKIQVNERTFCRLHGINSRSFKKLLQNLFKTSLITIENNSNNTIIIHSVSKRLKNITDNKGESDLPEIPPLKPKEKPKEKTITIKDVVNDEIWKDSVCLKHGLKTHIAIDHQLKEFDNHLVSIEEYHDTVKEYKKHFNSWLNKQDISTGTKLTGTI